MITGLIYWFCQKVIPARGLQILRDSRILIYYRGASFKITISKLMNSPFKWEKVLKQGWNPRLNIISITCVCGQTTLLKSKYTMYVHIAEVLFCKPYTNSLKNTFVTLPRYNIHQIKPVFRSIAIARYCVHNYIQMSRQAIKIPTKP